jgi:peptide/nickel transport system substrate-binding protein
MYRSLYQDHSQRLTKSLLAILPAAFLLSACATQPAAPEGVIRVAMQPMVQTDPAFISSDSEVLFANHVYDYLVDINPQNQIVPRLATEWTVSDDGLTYSFTLAEDIVFHDGTALTAEDVVWTFERLADPDLGTPTADLYSNIEAIEASGDGQVTFTLDEPNPFFLFDLSDNHALVLKANSANPATDFNGTGPFKVESYTTEDRVVLVANADYFIEGIPRLAGMEIIFFNDQSAMADALRGGQIDLMLRMSTSMFESLKADPDIVTFDIPTNGFDLIRLRSDRPPGDDPRVVQALKLATDREEIFELVQQGYGAVGRDSPIGPLYVDYYSEAVPIPERDVAAARALLEAAGFEAGLQLELHTPDTGGRPDLAAVLKQQWAEAGVEVEVLVEPESVYYGEDGWLEVDLGITGWGSRPLPQFYLDVMLECGATWNESHFCDAEFDELSGLAGSTLDEAERAAAYGEIQRILIERGPVIIPYYFAQFGALRDGFEGFELKAFAGRTDLSLVSVSQ